LLAESTDVFGVVGFIIGLFSVASLLLVCCWGIGVLIAVPLGWPEPVAVYLAEAICAWPAWW
jgi:hypothetical protein